MKAINATRNIEEAFWGSLFVSRAKINEAAKMNSTKRIMAPLLCIYGNKGCQGVNHGLILSIEGVANVIIKRSRKASEIIILNHCNILYIRPLKIFS